MCIRDRPYTALAASVEAVRGTKIRIAAQNMHWQSEGAFTGEVSAPMLVETGCSAVLIAHSERRQFFGETDETANKKVKAALNAGLTPILCVGCLLYTSTPVRFVHVGGASGEQNIELPGAALRSSAITLMGSGLKSVRLPVLLQSIRSVFEAVQPAGLKIATTVVPLSEVEGIWEKAAGKPRVVFSIG